MSAGSRRTLAAGLALAGWSIFLLDFVYLEPLPRRAGQLGGRARTVGAVLRALPFAVVAWAGVRHGRPLDAKPARPRPIAYPRYRGVGLGQPLPSALAVLGKPDGGDVLNTDFRYGRDLFEFSESRLSTVEIRGPRAQTAKGVRIGDSLALARSRYRAACGYDWTQDRWQPECRVRFDSLGGKELIFVGDPIESIKLY